MRRAFLQRCAPLVVVSLLLSGCMVMRTGGPPEPGAEQFVFDVVPGTGGGTEAEEIAGDLAAGEVEDATVVGRVDTPLGMISIVAYTEEADGITYRCRGTISPSGGGAACSSGDPPGNVSGPGPMEVRITGVGVMDDWTTVELEVGQAVTQIVATADGGTTYRSGVADGFSLIVYPTRRGPLTVRGLDGSGTAVSDPVETDDPRPLDQPPAPTDH